MKKENRASEKFLLSENTTCSKREEKYFRPYTRQGAQRRAPRSRVYTYTYKGRRPYYMHEYQRVENEKRGK